MVLDVVAPLKPKAPRQLSYEVGAHNLSFCYPQLTYVVMQTLFVYSDNNYGVLVMEVKDQLRLRMEELKMSATQLAKRVDVAPQTVRFWLNGRSYPGKTNLHSVEQALSFKLNFSSTANVSGTVEQMLPKTDMDTFLLIQQMPDQLKASFKKLAQDIVRLSSEVSTLSRAPRQR